MVQARVVAKASRSSEAIAARTFIHQMLVGITMPHWGNLQISRTVPKRHRHHTPTFQGRSIQVGPADDAHTNHFYVGEDHPVQGAFRYSITRMNP